MVARHHQLQIAEGGEDRYSVLAGGVQMQLRDVQLQVFDGHRRLTDRLSLLPEYK